MQRNFLDLLRMYVDAVALTVCHAQVDATLAKSVQRVTGSVIGAVYAFLVMLRPRVAGNPYAIAVMCCFSAFVCGLMVEHRFKYGSFLALYTSAVVMLAQVGFCKASLPGCVLQGCHFTTGVITSIWHQFTYAKQRTNAAVCTVTLCTLAACVHLVKLMDTPLPPLRAQFSLLILLS